MRKISPIQAIQAGWIRYKNKAGMYTAFTLFSFVVSVVIATVSGSIGGAFSFNLFIQTTIIAITAGIGYALLTIGYAHFARKDEAGEEAEFGNFLDGYLRDISCCLSSSLENMINFFIFGYFLRISLTHFLPKLPVPPVSNNVLLFSIANNYLNNMFKFCF